MNHDSLRATRSPSQLKYHPRADLRDRFAAFADEQLLTEAEAACIIGYSPFTLKTWRHRPPKFRSPTYISLGKEIRYRAGDIRDWIRFHAQQGAVSSQRNRGGGND